MRCFQMLKKQFQLKRKLRAGVEEKKKQLLMMNGKSWLNIQKTTLNTASLRQAQTDIMIVKMVLNKINRHCDCENIEL